MQSMTQLEILRADLEFVQNLCNGSYLQFLAQNKYFEEVTFMNYLSYLRYWNEPEYKQMLIFPQCLEILDNLLTNDAFRKELLIPQFIEYFHQQQGSFWMLDKSVTKLVDPVEASTLLAQNGGK